VVLGGGNTQGSGSDEGNRYGVRADGNCLVSKCFHLLLRVSVRGKRVS